jgi:hypothetical protein
MCLSLGVIEERTDRLFALLAAARTVMAGNAELGKEAFAGTTVLLAEVERLLQNFVTELKVTCDQTKEG